MGKRARAIAEIDGDSFVQSDFRTDHLARLGVIKEEGEKEKFDFGTSAESVSANKGLGQKDVDIGLAHPKLFGDQAKREKRFLHTVFALRQQFWLGRLGKLSETTVPYRTVLYRMVLYYTVQCCTILFTTFCNKSINIFI